MSFSVGIVGLPNVGKSTLFKALTKIKVDIADYPFTTVNPNVGLVRVPDERLEKITRVIKPDKSTPTVIKFVDIAGLVKNAHKGEGLGNQFLAQIRECDAIVEVVKLFGEKQTPEEDIEIIKTELEMKDKEIEERKLSSFEKSSKKNEGNREKENLLSEKPVIYLFNSNNGTAPISDKNYLVLNLKDESEMTDLSEKERQELGLETQLDQLILACYNILDLITFYTVTGLKETRAWTLKKGLFAPDAGGVVHTDFKEKFIRAECISWQKLIEAKEWKEAKEKGWMQTVGREYIVQDGDILEFKI